MSHPTAGILARPTRPLGRDSWRNAAADSAGRPAAASRLCPRGGGGYVIYVKYYLIGPVSGEPCAIGTPNNRARQGLHPFLTLFLQAPWAICGTLVHAARVCVHAW